MAKFQYKLQSVLDIKQKLENQEKIAFGLATAKLLEEQDTLQKLMLQKAGYDRQARKLLEGSINLLEINSCRKAVETMKTRIRAQVFEVHKAEKQLDIVRQRLNEVMIERKTYEKLREKKFDEFKAELLYEENKVVDELVSYTYHQNEE
ncbi:MAG: flagellar export protein FliJ [Eubacterium sp.]|jgi:flagellar FliJ protein|nr:flagellar export protein FliJ [Eubacterium sp.]